MVRRTRRVPDPDPEPRSKREGGRPKATVAAWVAVGVAVVEVVIRLLER